VTAAVEGGGRLYVSSQYNMYMLDARTGKVLGDAGRDDPKVPGVPYHALADKDRVIFLSEKVMCYGAKNLKELWNAPMKSVLFNMIPPVMTADRLIVFALPEVVALDLKTGKELWTLKLEGDSQFCTTAPAVRGTEVCVGFNGKLFAFDAVEGKSTWTLDAGKPDPPVPVAQPVWAGDRLVYAVGRRLFCFKPK
jgi:outer membrane protein assembly factor BamB